MDDTKILAGRLRELAARSYNSNIFTFTEFLGEAQLDLLLRMEKELSYAGIELYGGTECSDRVVARFGKESELGYDMEFPVVCLKISPLSEQFGEELTHRDYLGALMNLGIKRELLGDIILCGKDAYLFCLDHIADYIKDSLIRVRHTSVSVAPAEGIPENAGPRIQEQHVVVTSVRLDAVIARVWNLSRTQSQDLCREGKVFVNGRQRQNGSQDLKPEDRISVRGFGKFIYAGEENVTGKGRFRIRIRLFV